MVKTILKILGGIVGGFIILIIAASIAIGFVVNEGLIEDQMKKALNRHVQIEDVSVGLFAFVSGIKVEGVKISNFKTEKQLEILKGKPVAANDVFVSTESIRLKFKFLPLLKKNFELKELVLYSPTVNVSRSAAGYFNFDDLTRPKKLTPEEQAELAKEAAEPSKPFTADTIPIALSVGEVGVRDGVVNYYDGRFNQRFQVYKLKAVVKNIKIDPNDLENKNDAKIEIYMGVKTVGPMRTGSVQSFDITFDVSGNAKPFDVKTKKLDPEISLHAGSPEGEITGLQIFNSIAGNGILNRYLGNQLSFLKGKQSWKGSRLAYVDLWYKGSVAKLTNGNLKLKECRLLFDGSTNTASKALNVNLELELLKSRNNAIKVGIRKQIESGLKQLGVDKYAKADNITEAAMKPLLNKNGMVYLKFRVAGTTAAPTTQLTHPQLGSIDSLIKAVAGDAIKAAAKDAGGKLIKDGLKKIKLPKLF